MIIEGSCEEQQFTCDNKKCIMESMRCDDEDDCGDNSDEMNCEFTCGHGFWKCGDGKCIRQSWRCDDEDDCGDASDEINC